MPRRRTSAIETTLNLTGKAAVGLFKWAATNHYGSDLSSMPKMGFTDTLKLILMQFLFSILGAVLTAAWTVFLFFIALPYLLFGTTLIP